MPQCHQLYRCATVGLLKVKLERGDRNRTVSFLLEKRTCNWYTIPAQIGVSSDGADAGEYEQSGDHGVTLRTDEDPRTSGNSAMFGSE